MSSGSVALASRVVRCTTRKPGAWSVTRWKLLAATLSTPLVARLSVLSNPLHMYRSRDHPWMRSVRCSGSPLRHSRPGSPRHGCWLDGDEPSGTGLGFAASKRRRCRDPVKPACRFLTLASGLVAVLAACTTSPHPPAARAVRAPAERSQSVRAKAACPAGRLLPHRQEVMIEWVDFLQVGGRQYVAGLGPTVSISRTQLGPVITRVRCSIAANDDHRHVGFRLADGSAAFLPAGAAVYEVRGYLPRCRLAGYWGGQLHAYLAQHDVHGHSAPLPCALRVPAT